jgi:hypothetical protein
MHFVEIIDGDLGQGPDQSVRHQPQGAPRIAEQRHAPGLEEGRKYRVIDVVVAVEVAEANDLGRPVREVLEFAQNAPRWLVRFRCVHGPDLHPVGLTGKFGPMTSGCCMQR